MTSCAQSNLKKVSLELGGKSPLIIFADCDLNKAVRMVSSVLSLLVVTSHSLWLLTAYCFSFLVLLTKLQRQVLKFNLFLNLQVYYMHVQLEFTLFWQFQVEFY